ncbi:uncharacterized protein [Antedon mediterranea]|uniref:uncharacterized protein n=1 Tax=Antedon mediterranea TaxID=105859 RepID=UPI003AF825B3
MDHSICLEPVCRLCGCKRAIREGCRPHLKEKYENIIISALKINVTFDVLGVHPPYICLCCIHKLKRWRKFSNRNIKKNCNIHVVSFQDTECKFCNVTEVVPVTLEDFRNAAVNSHLIPWFPTEDELHFIKLTKDGNNISINLTVLKDFSWSLIVAGITMPTKSLLGEDFGEFLNLQDFSKLCNVIENAGTCTGNQDFPDVVEKKKGPEGQIPINITKNDIYCHLHSTIRHKKCELLVSKDTKRCRVCKIFRSDLSAKRNAYRAPGRDQLKPKTPNIHLSRAQLEDKLATLKGECRQLKQRNRCLQDKVTMYANERAKLLAVMDDVEPEIESNNI